MLLTDTTMRDAHQSLLATRMRTIDMLKVVGWRWVEGRWVGGWVLAALGHNLQLEGTQPLLQATFIHVRMHTTPSLTHPVKHPSIHTHSLPANAAWPPPTGGARHRAPAAGAGLPGVLGRGHL